MAIIRCPECNHETSTLAQTCPFCGVNIAGNIVICPDCGKTLLRHTKVCPNCSCDISNTPVIPSPVIRQNADGKPLNGKMPEPRKKHSKWPWIALVSVILLCTGGYFLYEYIQYEQNIKSDYLALNENYNIKDYTAFMANYPESRFSEEVSKRLEALKITKQNWEEIVNADTVTAYKNFLIKYPKSAYTDICKNKIDSLEWLDASSENTQEAYQKYLSTHADGKYADLAKKVIEDLDKLIVSPAEKDSVRKVVSEYFNMLSQHNPSGLARITSEKLSEVNNYLLAESATYTILGNPYIGKIPSRIPDVYNYISKFQVEKQIGETKETYQGRFLITTNMRIVTIKLTRVENPEVEGAAGY